MLNPPSGWLPVLADPEAIAGDIIALAETDLPLVLQLRAENREKDTDNLFKSYSNEQRNPLILFRPINSFQFSYRPIRIPYCVQPRRDYMEIAFSTDSIIVSFFWIPKNIQNHLIPFP